MDNVYSRVAASLAENLNSVTTYMLLYGGAVLANMLEVLFMCIACASCYRNIKLYLDSLSFLEAALLRREHMTASGVSCLCDAHMHWYQDTAILQSMCHK